MLSHPWMKWVMAGGAVLLLVKLFFSGGNGEVRTIEREPVRNSTIAHERIPVEELALLGSNLEEVSRRSEEAERRAATMEEQVTELTQMIRDLRESPAVTPSESDIDVDLIIRRVETLIEDRLVLSLESGVINPGQAPHVDEALRTDRRPTETTRSDSASGFETPFEISNAPADSERDVTWVYPVGFDPLDALAGDALSARNPFLSESQIDNREQRSGDMQSPPEAKPFITIPPDSWMFDATALTALVGRVERSGVNHAPWDFNVLLSGDVAIANNHILPEIEDARVSGVAIGDQATQCIRGYVTSITFVFTDGRVFHQSSSMDDPLAYLGDEYGNPCVPGEYFSNTAELLATYGSVAGIQSIARSIEQRQQTVSSSNAGHSISLTGSDTQAAIGAFGAGSARQLGEIIAERYEAYYPFVYAPAGQSVSLRFRQSINVDYQYENRKVRYEENLGYSWP